MVGEFQIVKKFIVNSDCFDDDEFDFTHGIEEEEEEGAQNTMKHGETFSLGNMGEVDIDDI